MKYPTHAVSRNLMVCLIAGFALSMARFATADGPKDQPTIRGDVQVIDGIKVLRVHGDPHDRGFAYGYLMANDIIGLIDGYLKAESISGGAPQFEAMTRKMRGIMKIPPANMEELRGMFAGIERKLDGKTTVPQLGRLLKIDDLVTINCIPDAVGFGCSSFAAWGNCTADGKTIAGRNLDWHTIDALRDSQFVVATIPAKDDPAAAWLTVTWPGLIGCLTGMNESGVTVSMHDAFTKPPALKKKPTPRGLVLREAIETAKRGSVKDDILTVLSQHRVLVGNIIPVSMPMRENGQPSMVFEYDSYSGRSSSDLVRMPRNLVTGEDAKAADWWQVATNHYYDQKANKQCRRYARLNKDLDRFPRDESLRLTVDIAWDLLTGVSEKGGLTTYHSVIFEPNAMKMHVSFCHDGKSAPTNKRVELDVAKLLERPVSERH